jgi:heptaprenyl diphosphate synthase
MSKIGIPNLDRGLEASLITDMQKVEDLLRSHIKGDYPLVIDTSRHLVEAGGKRLRPLLTLIAAQFGDASNHDIIKAAVCCELTHLATLYHDDVMDDAVLRRGVISANKKWNNAVAILTGDYLFSKVSDMLADIGPEAVKLQAKTFERLVIGQIKETQGKSDGLTQIEHYLKVVSDKTGSLIATSARFGALLSGAKPEVVDLLTKFGEKIGTAFQIADDLLDISSSQTASGKTPGTDLKEGIPTLVTLFVISANDPADKDLIVKLSGPISEEDLSQVINALRGHKALIQVQEYLANLAVEANALLTDLPEGAAKTALTNLTLALVNRST